MIFQRGANSIEISEPNENFFIYRISGNNKSYVGMSKDVITRFEQHLTGKGSQLLLHDIVIILNFPHVGSCFNIAFLTILRHH